MHFHKLELQLSNAPGFRLGNLLPFADFCLTILCAQLRLMMMWLRNEIELPLQSCALFADLIVQKCFGPLSFSNLCHHLLDDDVVDIWTRALGTVSGTFCRPHRPKVLRPWQFFLRFLCEIELSLQSGAPFVDLIFQKRPGPDRFLTIVMWNWNRALATVLRTFCRPLSPIEPRNCGNWDPSATTAVT